MIFYFKKAATSFFEVDYKEFSQRELMQLVLQSVKGETFDSESFEELAPAERKHLEEILSNLKEPERLCKTPICPFQRHAGTYGFLY